MLAIVLGSLLLSAAPATSEASRAETFAAAGEAHLRRAAEDRSVDTFEEAHKNFDNAYLLTEEPRYLCRALAVTELALSSATFANEQVRLSWEELRRDDLDRLRNDAAQAQRANCRFDPSGKPLPPRVALLDPDGPAPAAAPRVDGGAAAPANMAAPGPAKDTSERTRRGRALTATGAIFTAAGVGLLGGFVGVVELERRRAAEIKDLIAAARAEDRYFTDDETQQYHQLTGELRHGLKVAIGVGAASVVSLTTGIVVLATQKRVKTQRYAIHPYGGLQGAGAVLRLRF